MCYVVEKAVNVLRFHLSIIDIIFLANKVIFRNFLPVHTFGVLPQLFLKQFQATQSYIRDIDPFEVEFCAGKR